MYNIEIDDEIYNFLKSKAEPFISPPDTPNSVLRRLLLKEYKTHMNRSSEITVEHLPGSVPKALEQILQVIWLMDTQGLSRLKATAKLANYYDYAPQTIEDKYTRQIDLKAYQFDELLAETGRLNLARRLNNRFPGFEKEINKYLKISNI